MSRFLPTRRDDERVLAWLRLFDAGQSFGDIALRYGTTRNAVAGAIQRVHREMEK